MINVSGLTHAISINPANGEQIGHLSLIHI